MGDRDGESEVRQRLIDAGASSLADALLELAQGSGDVAETVQRPAATPDQNLKRGFWQRSEEAGAADD